MEISKAKLRISLLISMVLLLASCVSAVNYIPPEPTAPELQQAQVQINRTGVFKKNTLSDLQNKERLNRVVYILQPHARELCRSLGERSNSGCSFQVLFDESEEFNAYATTKDGKNIVIVTNGALKYTHSDSELAFIVAHEFGHHIGNHLAESQGFTVGEGIGLLIGLSVIGNEYFEPDLASDIVSASTELGGMFDRPGFSRSQESEADLFATKLVVNASYDINEATQVLVNMATISNAGGFFSTHPSGPVRLATAKRHVGSTAMASIEMQAPQIPASIARVEIQEPRSESEPEPTSVAFRNEPDIGGTVNDRTEAIRAVLKDYGHLDDFYVENLPGRKVAGFLEKANLSDSIDVLGYLDTTVWGSGKNGIVFTPEGVHYTNDFTSGAGGSHFISYEGLIKNGRPTFRNRYFYIGHEGLPENGLIDLIGSSTNIEEFSLLFSKIVNWNKY